MKVHYKLKAKTDKGLEYNARQVIGAAGLEDKVVDHDTILKLIEIHCSSIALLMKLACTVYGDGLPETTEDKGDDLCAVMGVLDAVYDTIQLEINKVKIREPESESVDEVLTSVTC